MYGIHHPIHDYKRLVGCIDGTRTADTYGSGRSRFSGSGEEVGTCDAALKGIVDRQHRSALYVRHLYGRDRTCQVFLGYLAITDHDHFIQSRRLLLFHSDIESSRRSYRQSDCLESEELELQCIGWPHFDREFPVSVGDRSAPAVRDYDSGTRHRYSVCVYDCTCHSPDGLLGGSLPRECGEKHQRCQLCQHQG